MGSKNILAYFKSPENAREAAMKLASLGVTEVEIDRFSKYPGDGLDRWMNPLTGNISSLARQTLGMDPSSRDASVLAASDVSASGMSDGGPGSITERDILLTAVVDDLVHQRALQAIREAGGMV
jgi:hypothetical protein